jgi:hypothetical protein
MLEPTSNVCNDGTRHNLRNGIEQITNRSQPARTYWNDLCPAHGKGEAI